MIMVNRSLLVIGPASIVLGLLARSWVLGCIGVLTVLAGVIVRYTDSRTGWLSGGDRD